MLVEAAAKIIDEKGYDRTSLEEVAARAGMTRGAIYGNFKNKEELFLAVVAARWQPIAPAFEAGAGFSEQMRILADAVIAAMPARRRMAIGAASFQLYALTHNAMRSRIANANDDIYRQLSARMQALAGGSELPLAPDLFVRVVHAITEGLMLLHALTPELIDERVVHAAFEVLGSQKQVN